MSDPLFKAFKSDDFYSVFVLMAATSHAQEFLSLDVPSLHADVRTAIRRIAAAGIRVNNDPAVRNLLIQGPAGSGKTHCLITTLLQLVCDEKCYPAVMQLTAKVNPEQISRWMLTKVLDELTAHYFQDKNKHTPLKKLADALWARADAVRREGFQEALDAEDFENAIQYVFKAVPGIRKACGIQLRDELLLTALLLVADGISFDADAWLRGGASDYQIAGKIFPSLNGDDGTFQEILFGLIRIAEATGVPLLLVFDQIESMTQITDKSLLVAVITTALQLLENCPNGLGLVISALEDTYDTHVKSMITNSFRQRIEYGEPPITMNVLKPKEMRLALVRRVECLLNRAGLDNYPNAMQYIAPDWLLDNSQAGGLREILRDIHKYRQACLVAGRFLEQEEYLLPEAAALPIPVAPQIDFEKLWADACDSDLGAIVNFSFYDREQMVIWLAEHVANELSKIDAVSADAYLLQDKAATRVIDLRFKIEGDVTVERWKIALAEAPNVRNQLLEQIRVALDRATNANPALLRTGPMPGVTDAGLPDRSLVALRKLQVGPALANHFAAGGRVVCTTVKYWQRLKLTQGFYEKYIETPGFLDWCKQQHFLFKHADLGPIMRLMQLEGAAGIVEIKKPVISKFIVINHLNQDVNLKPLQSLEAPAPSVPPKKMHTEVKKTSSVHQQEHKNKILNQSNELTSANQTDQLKIFLGHDLQDEVIYWNCDQTAQPALPNFGLLVSGDAGQGKTQAIKTILAQLAHRDYPILIFDFKNDYADAIDAPFASKHDFTVIDLNQGLPFNPLAPPPHGSNGTQVITHIYEVSAILATTLRLGDQQKALLRDALELAFERLNVSVQQWVDPETVPAPALEDVIAIAQKLDEKKSQTLCNRLGLLHGKRLLPSDANAKISFANLVEKRFVLSFHALPNDDQLKNALAELILIQLQGYMLRGSQPRTLQRILVFDEAWRAAKSARLINLAREGRAFGVGIIAGSQFADDLASELTGNLASKLFFYNSDANRQRQIVQASLGGFTNAEPRFLLKQLGQLEKFVGVLTNQQYLPYRVLKIQPYFSYSSHNNIS